MKRIISLLAAILLLFCACSKKEVQQPKTADMLNITNTDETFLGCRSRLDAVLSAMSSKISTLESAHNAVIKAENENEYFLESNYILTTFEPFNLSSLSITDGFTADMTNETAQTYYELQSGGMDISFTSNDENYELMFVSESVVKSYTAEYDAETDSLRYTYTVENSGNETVEEFIEFSKAESGAYVIQSGKARCYIKFNSEDEIEYFCCGELYSGGFTLDESIYPSPDEALDEYWVISRGKTEFSNIHTFENNVLTHEDRSSGPWKSVKINADDYASAFYG